MFEPVSPKLNITSLEDDILHFWKKHDIFHKCSDLRRGGQEYVFYEGPPTANGRPGVHHVLARVFKDIFPRYKTMRGYHVSRRGGWDTHGLPVEIEVEKKLGFNNKQQIEAYGIDKFNDLCRQSVFEYIHEWERLTDRIAFWVDLKDAYITYNNSYIESVWWILKSLWDKDLLYQGYKVVPYCPRCGTPLSDHEVALGYEQATDPSVFIRLPLVDSPDTSLLVWTTTPWTLPANVAVAAHPDVNYVKVKYNMTDGGDEYLILAEALLSKVIAEGEIKIVDKFKGKHLKGKRYKPLYTFLPTDKPAHRVVLAEFVTTEDGTGLVHMAPAFGADDMQMAQEHDLPILMTVAPDGTFIPEVRQWSGMFVKDADPAITEDLKTRGLLFKAETYTHTYPFCWRCDTPLLYYARKTWYIRTSQYKDRLVAINNQINWVPNHIKTGRFGNWLENNVDWALGRERYWGTPLPVWECQECHHQLAVGSVAELAKLAGCDLSDLDLHRPYVDAIRFPCPKCSGTMQRVVELIDVWFDSGSMPVAQWHYPFENQVTFKNQFPADYICEAVDQTRGWFYSLHAISTMLFDTMCFKNVICLGLILDGDGQKMSKSRGNFISPWEILDAHGADAFRWYLYTATPPGQERRFSSELVGEVVRNFMLMLWNTYSFFITYARLDEWEPDPGHKPAYSDLDKWLLSSLNALVRDVTQAMETYDVTGCTRPIERFVNDLSNWYLRRSRRRFWKSGSDADKLAAYDTLYQALVTVAKLLAPTMPFMAEELYQNLVCSIDESAPLSIHLADWPGFDSSRIDEEMNRDMALVMQLASLGHAARNKANRKVRQPLARVNYAVGSAEEHAVIVRYAELLKDELNVKEVGSLQQAGEAVDYSLNPLPKQLGQKYGAKFPAIRQALILLDADKTAPILLEGKPIMVKVNGEKLEILPEEVEVRVQAHTGYTVAADGPYLAALVTELTPELVQEGLAREFVRRVQDLRKQADLDIADRIAVYYQASIKLAAAIQSFADYISAETLAVELLNRLAPENCVVVEDEFDGEKVTISLEKRLL
ncbi:MAG: isoleucine--tRNA ligase [Anaerolineaceae bacterium]|nr:isoleucine--tRNA ligase [Anaerolineaceae bacterium]MBN2678582.1 isoleucine--tRNA ligase [Anaerolineaceae bacterium]